MHRRTFLRNSSLATAVPLLPAAWIKNLHQDNPWQLKMIRNDVGYFTEKGGTIGFVSSKKGIIVVDSEFPEQAQHLIHALHKDSNAPFELLINTHHHGDHTSGNIAFRGQVKSVAAHINSKANQQRVAKEQQKEDQQLYPDITYGDTWEYIKAKEPVKTYYFGPAHTNGDSIIHFQSANVAHMGDLVFNRRYAFVDRSAGASIDSWIRVLGKSINTFDNDTIFIFGHAFDPEKVTGGKADLKAMQDYLSALMDFAQKQLKAGMSKADFIKSTAIPGVTEWQGDGIDRCLQAAYEEVSEKVI